MPQQRALNQPGSAQCARPLGPGTGGSAMRCARPNANFKSPARSEAPIRPGNNFMQRLNAGQKSRSGSGHQFGSTGLGPRMAQTAAPVNDKKGINFWSGSASVARYATNWMTGSAARSVHSGASSFGAPNSGAGGNSATRLPGANGGNLRSFPNAANRFNAFQPLPRTGARSLHHS